MPDDAVGYLAVLIAVLLALAVFAWIEETSRPKRKDE